MWPRSPHRLLCRWLTGALGHEIEAADLPATPAQWQQVLSLSSAHLVGPVLPRAARAHGLWSQLPPDPAAFLDAVYALNLDRNAQSLDQIDHLTQALNSIGVRPVLLKGGAALVGGLYPSVGERIIGDIDILIPPLRLPDILERLADAGYRSMDGGEALTTAKDFPGHFGHLHYPPITSPTWPLRVDLHIAVSRAPALLSADEIVMHAKPLSWRGGELLLPSPTHFVMHNAIHAFAQDFRSQGRLSLRQLFEFVHASQFYGAQVDWDTLAQRFQEVGDYHALSGYVAFAHANLDFAIPPAIRVDGWDKALVLIDRIGAVRVFHPLVRRARSFLRHPGRGLTKALTPRSYARLWQDLWA